MVSRQGDLVARTRTARSVCARTDRKIEVRGFDIDEHSIDLCKKHAKKAGIFCDWQVRDIKDFSAQEQSGIIVVNPPYGERMLEKEQVLALYRQMRRVFSAYPGWSVNVFYRHARVRNGLRPARG